MRVLLLTSQLGYGHTRAAEAIEHALVERDSAVEIKWLDLWSLMDEKVAEAVKAAYLQLVTHQPELYEQLYQLDQRTWRQLINADCLPEPLTELLWTLQVRLFPDPRRWLPAKDSTLDQALFVTLLATLTGQPMRMQEKLVRRGLLVWIRMLLTRRLKAELIRFVPDVIVATQMHPAALLSLLKGHGALGAIPVIGVLTDFGVHDFWVQPRTDRYCVATEAMAADLRRRGVPAARIHVTGIPLMANFANPPPSRVARERLGLNPAHPTVLVTGGWYGIGVIEAAENLLNREPNCQVLVTQGRDSQQCQSLDRLVARYPDRLRLYGWTTEMPTLITAADVVVGKPGGLTVAETLACGRPFLATHWLGGQEGFNVRFLKDQGIGEPVSPDRLADALHAMLGCPKELERLQAHARQLGRREGAKRIATLVVTLAGWESRSGRLWTSG